MRGILVAIGLWLALVSTTALAGTVPDWSWLFPLAAKAPVDNAGTTRQRVVSSTRAFSGAQIQDLKHAVDWFPAEHPAMPAAVAAGHDAVNACGFCHLPTGNGRPENSALAGLSADYIKRQVAAFANGSRRSVLSSALPGKLMTATAKAVSPMELGEAADYFSKLRYTSHVRVIETAALGFRPARFVYALQPGPRQPIGNRIIEVPVDPDEFELRDPHARFIAYVPAGSIAAGRALVASGGPAGQKCAICHGTGLRSGIAPALAGRSPTTIVRQLAAFQVGARADAEAAPMRIVTTQLGNTQMIALAAYIATLKP